MKVCFSLVLGSLFVVALAIAQQPEIVGFARDGNLTFNSASQGKDYRLEFAPSANGPWQASLIDAPITGAVMTATTPQYFRVVEAEPRQLNPCVEQYLIGHGYDWNGNRMIDGEEVDPITSLPLGYLNGIGIKVYCNSTGDLRGLTNLVNIDADGGQYFPNLVDLDGDLLPASIEFLNWNPETLVELAFTNLHNLVVVQLEVGAGSTINLTGLTQPIGGFIDAHGAAFVYVSSTTNFTALSLSGGATFVVQ
jgi:hypothetical protein